MPVNRLFVSSAKHEGKGAMSVGPLERQLSVAVVTHNSACLFWSGHAWFHINEEQLEVLFQGLCPSESGLGYLLDQQE